MANRNLLQRGQTTPHIKSFIGTGKNAAMIQIWTALITILLLKSLKTPVKYNWRLSRLAAFIRLNLFVKLNYYGINSTG